MILPLPVAKALEKSINTLANLDPDSKSRLALLQGQVIKLQLNGPDLDVFLFIHADSIEVMSAFDGEVDTVIAGKPAAMLAMRSSTSGLFSGDVEITGNLESGKRFKRYLDALDIDWEEQLSHIVGDSVAYQIGSLVRNLNTFVQKSSDSLGDNISEYLTEESLLVAPASEVSHFAEDVDVLRADYDRLNARVDALEKKQDKIE